MESSGYLVFSCRVFQGHSVFPASTFSYSFSLEISVDSHLIVRKCRDSIEPLSSFLSDIVWSKCGTVPQLGHAVLQSGHRACPSGKEASGCTFPFPVTPTDQFFIH